MVNKDKSDIVCSSILLVLSIAVFFYVKTLKPETSYMPRIIAIIMGVCSVYQIISTIIKTKKREGETISIDLALIGKAFLLFVGYIALIKVLGFYIATALFIVLFFYLFGVRSIWAYVIAVGFFLLMTRFLFVELLYFRPAKPFFM